MCCSGRGLVFVLFPAKFFDIFSEMARLLHNEIFALLRFSRVSRLFYLLKTIIVSDSYRLGGMWRGPLIKGQVLYMCSKTVFCNVIEAASRAAVSRRLVVQNPLCFTPLDSSPQELSFEPIPIVLAFIL